MGMSRDTFYRYKSAVEDGGVEALFERIRRKPNLANRVDQATEDAVIQSATDFPAYGQARTSNELRKLGVFVSPSGVRSIWLRHDLANFKNRLKALEAKVADASVGKDAIICLDCGKGFKTLKRHLNAEHDMSPAEYRARWQLSKDYPLVAPSYSKRRSATAKKIGLGRKPKAK